MGHQAGRPVCRPFPEAMSTHSLLHPAAKHKVRDCGHPMHSARQQECDTQWDTRFRPLSHAVRESAVGWWLRGRSRLQAGYGRSLALHVVLLFVPPQHTQRGQRASKAHPHSVVATFPYLCATVAPVPLPRKAPQHDCLPPPRLDSRQVPISIRGAQRASSLNGLVCTTREAPVRCVKEMLWCHLLLKCDCFSSAKDNNAPPAVEIQSAQPATPRACNRQRARILTRQHLAGPRSAFFPAHAGALLHDRPRCAVGCRTARALGGSGRMVSCVCTAFA
jgi:hypothetical protein